MEKKPVFYSVRVDRYLNLDTNRTYPVLSLFNGFSGQVQIKLTPKQEKELRASIAAGTAFECTNRLVDALSTPVK